MLCIQHSETLRNNLLDNQEIKFTNFNSYQNNEQNIDKILIAETKLIEDAMSE